MFPPNESKEHRVEPVDDWRLALRGHAAPVNILGIGLNCYAFARGALSQLIVLATLVLLTGLGLYALGRRA